MSVSSSSHTEFDSQDQESNPSPLTIRTVPASVPRHRKWAPKVRTGCTTCRCVEASLSINASKCQNWLKTIKACIPVSNFARSTRRVKCDEAKPQCTRCSSSGRPCNYPLRIKSSCSEQPLLFTQDVHIRPTSVSIQPIYAVSPAETNSTDEERRMFYFFRTEAASQLAGVFDQRFCTMELLQASKLHPAVWHACTALAAMYQRESLTHGSRKEGEAHQRHYVFALRQYDVALKNAVKMIAKSAHGASSTDQEILLTSCLLFTAICCLQGDLRAAMVHLRNGQKIFYQWRHANRTIQPTSQPPENGLISPPALMALMSRLCTQSIELRDSHWAEWELHSIGQAKVSQEPFRTPVDAYLELEPIFNEFIEARQKYRRLSAIHPRQPAHPLDLYRTHQAVLTAWQVKFSQLQSSRVFHDVDLEGMLVLEARYLAFDIELNKDPSSELHWDMFQSKFERIIAIAEQLCGLVRGSQMQTRPVRAFSFSSTAHEEVFRVARYCRHYETRHRALDLLASWSFKEGICDTNFARVLAECMAELEEAPGVANREQQSLAQCMCDGFFICADHRISQVTGELTGDGMAVMLFRTVGDVAQGSSGTITQVAW
ncbi:hypothetical protein QQS21_002149 [Conoideocrella luteorostrata]|uniref:Zn(2)-C6 fungal-type domain-containing protein n=1 Tax=Conoideocrella luteorostrata TaxID=1105319 RepID=A0AAJ0CWR8_9HYPO|nr:hypothetical protein QQS21_002149 [Conoideocrella luteorostrata]